MLFNFENWENIIHFGIIFASVGKKHIPFGFGNDTHKRSLFYSEKNHWLSMKKVYNLRPMVLFHMGQLATEACFGYTGTRGIILSKQ